MIDSTRTFGSLRVGDFVYEVTPLGEIKEHQLTKVNTSSNPHFFGFEWHNGSYSVPMKEIQSHGYASFFTVHHRAVKLANSRKKQILKFQIKHYEEQIKRYERDLKSAKTKLGELRNQLNNIV